MNYEGAHSGLVFGVVGYQTRFVAQTLAEAKFGAVQDVADEYEVDQGTSIVDGRVVPNWLAFLMNSALIPKGDMDRAAVFEETIVSYSLSSAYIGMRVVKAQRWKVPSCVIVVDSLHNLVYELKKENPRAKLSVNDYMSTIAVSLHRVFTQMVDVCSEVTCVEFTKFVFNSANRVKKVNKMKRMRLRNFKDLELQVYAMQRMFSASEAVVEQLYTNTVISNIVSKCATPMCSTTRMFVKYMGAGVSTKTLRRGKFKRQLSKFPKLLQVSKQAYVTLLTADVMDYALSAVVLGYSIDTIDSSRDRVVIVTPEVGSNIRNFLKESGWIVHPVTKIPEVWFGTSKCKYRSVKGMHQGVRWGRMSSKLHLWNLDYDIVVYMDADTLAVGRLFDFFEHSKWENMIWGSDAKLQLIGEGGTGHDWVNAGFLVVKPSKDRFNEMLEYGKTHRPPQIFPNLVDCTEQALINAFFGKPIRVSNDNVKGLELGVDHKALVLDTSNTSTNAIGRPDVARQYERYPPYAIHFVRQDRCLKPWKLLQKHSITLSTCKKHADESLAQSCDKRPYYLYLAVAHVNGVTINV